MDTRALRFHGVDDLRLERIAQREPADGEVLTEVRACGVCGSDLHFLDGSARTGRVPVTLGHEVAATVSDSRHPDWSEGDDVLVAAGVECGTCRRCREGRINLCEHRQVVGIDFDGGLADWLVVPGQMLLRRPPGITAEVAATAVDAGSTAYHAVVRRAAVRQGDAVLVLGAGGLGAFGLQIAKSLGAAPVIVADVNPDAIARADRLGADETILVEEGISLGRTVKLLTDGGVDVAIEFVGRASTVDAAVKSLRPGGTAVAVGVGMEPLVTIPPVLWSTQEYALVGSYGSLRGDAEQVLTWLADGTISPPPLEQARLEEARDIILAMARGEQASQGRLVVIP
ncbi:MAG: zinc-binding dehydrogenase [Acidimicrobiia bacterium]